MKDCFDPRSYGAVADGHSKDTAAVQAAIDAAAAQGGTVRLAGGTFVCGTLYLKSNVALEITNSATLLASPDIADYGTDTHHNRYRNEPELDRCFLFAQDAENVTICGSGVIDGNAAAFPNAGSIYRLMLLRVLRCRNVRVQNLRLLNAAAWATAFLDSDFIWATDLHIENHRNYNGDGLDFDSCRHVWVRGCYIDGTDDNLCLQSSGLPVQDVHISDCAFTSVCVGIRIGLKSIGEISGVVISNCTMRNIWREGIKLECTEGGSITDILVENVTMHNVRRPIFAILNNRYRPDDLGIVDGAGQFQINDRLFPVRAHQLVVVNPNVIHTEVSLESHPLECIVLGIEGVEFTISDTSEGSFCVYTFDGNNDVLPCMRKILTEMQNRESNFQILCQAYMDIIVVQLMRNASVSAVPIHSRLPANRQCATVKRYIDHHYKENLTLDELAEKVSISKYHMAHAFKREYGVSPINYIIDCRIQEGKRLLAETDLAPSQIASILGFSSSSYFCKTFSNIEGTSPTEYRKANQVKF